MSKGQFLDHQIKVMYQLNYMSTEYKTDANEQLLLFITIIF